MTHTSSHTYGCRISDEWQIRGLRAAILENELLRVVILLDKGAEIVEFCFKPRDFNPLLRLPGGIRNPRNNLPSVASQGEGFLDYYVGGWQEILPNGGPAATWKGAAYGQHGEVCLVSWDSQVEENSPERVTLVCRVRPLRTPVFLERKMTLERGRAVLTLQENLVNESNERVDLMWGHHVAFGLPFLEQGAEIATSARRLIVHEEWDAFKERRLKPGQTTDWPHATASDGTTVDVRKIPALGEARGSEMAYLTDFDGPAWYAITNVEQRMGFAMRWDANVFRYLWLWQELSSGIGFPWWGRTHAVALEPWTSYPTLGLPEAVARGTQLTLEPNQSLSTRLLAVAYEGLKRVTAIHEDGSVTGELDD